MAVFITVIAEGRDGFSNELSAYTKNIVLPLYARQIEKAQTLGHLPRVDAVMAYSNQSLALPGAVNTHNTTRQNAVRFYQVLNDTDEKTAVIVRREHYQGQLSFAEAIAELIKLEQKRAEPIQHVVVVASQYTSASIHSHTGFNRDQVNRADAAGFSIGNIYTVSADNWQAFGRATAPDSRRTILNCIAYEDLTENHKLTRGLSEFADPAKGNKAPAILSLLGPEPPLAKETKNDKTLPEAPEKKLSEVLKPENIPQLMTISAPAAAANIEEEPEESDEFEDEDNIPSTPEGIAFGQLIKGDPRPEKIIMRKQEDTIPPMIASSEKQKKESTVKATKKRNSTAISLPRVIPREPVTVKVISQLVSPQPPIVAPPNNNGLSGASANGQNGYHSPKPAETEKKPRASKNKTAAPVATKSVKKASASLVAKRKTSSYYLAKPKSEARPSVPLSTLPIERIVELAPDEITPNHLGALFVATGWGLEGWAEKIKQKLHPSKQADSPDNQYLHYARKGDLLLSSEVIRIAQNLVKEFLGISHTAGIAAAIQQRIRTNSK
jgi:hypothetical protein